MKGTAEEQKEQLSLHFGKYWRASLFFLLNLSYLKVRYVFNKKKK